MSAADLAAVVVTVVCLAVIVVLVIAVQALVRTIRELRATVDDLHTTVNKAGEELERVDGIIDRAERISTTVDVASRLTLKAMAPPLIKTMSFVAGAGRATRRLRSGRSRAAIDVASRATS